MEICTSLPRHWLWASCRRRRQCSSNNISNCDSRPKTTATTKAATEEEEEDNDEKVELYIILDAAVYVTVSDMQTAVARIRNEFLKASLFAV